MPSGPPKWSSTIVVSGKARARSVSSRQLRVVQPGVEAQAQRRQLREAFAKAPVQQQALGRLGVRIADRRAGMPAGGMPDAAKAAARGVNVRLQHLAHRGAQAQVGEAHDAGGDTRRPEAAAGAHRGDALHELGLAHRPQRIGPVGAIHRRTFDEHRAAHVVARALCIGALMSASQFVQQIAIAGAMPQVVMRIDRSGASGRSPLLRVRRRGQSAAASAGSSGAGVDCRRRCGQQRWCVGRSPPRSLVS